MSGPNFPEVQASLKPATAGPPTIYNVAFPFDTTGALAKPVTELGIINAATLEAKELVKECLEMISVATNRLSSFNSVVDKEDIFIFISGWESVEVRPCRSSSDICFFDIFTFQGMSKGPPGDTGVGKHDRESPSSSYGGGAVCQIEAIPAEVNMRLEICISMYHNDINPHLLEHCVAMVYMNDC